MNQKLDLLKIIKSTLGFLMFTLDIYMLKMLEFAGMNVCKPIAIN